MGDLANYVYERPDTLVPRRVNAYCDAEGRGERLSPASWRYDVKTTKLTIYLDESLKRLIKETSGNRKISDVVSDVLESYVAAGSIRELGLPHKTSATELPSL